MSKVFKKQSMTITGLIILLLGFGLAKIGVPLAEGELETTITTLIKIVGGLMAYFGRLKQGDVNFLGMRKGK